MMNVDSQPIVRFCGERMLFGKLTPVFDTSAKGKRWKTDKAEAVGGYFNFRLTYYYNIKIFTMRFENKVYTFALNRKNSPFWLFGVHSQTIKTTTTMENAHEMWAYCFVRICVCVDDDNFLSFV